MRKAVWVAGIVLFAAVLLFFLRSPKELPKEIGEAPVATPTVRSNAIAQQPATTAAPISRAITNAPEALVANVSEHAGAVPPPPPAPDLPAESVVENVSHAVHQYREMFGSNPVGTNEEITKALNGNNPKKINFIDAQTGMRVNGQGELIDPWESPLFFHQLSGTEMEVRSAGPDKKMWTVDDLVTR